MTGDFEASKSVLASESRSSTAVSCCRRRFPCPKEGSLFERSEERAKRSGPPGAERGRSAHRRSAHNHPSVGPAAHVRLAAETVRSATTTPPEDPPARGPGA